MAKKGTEIPNVNWTETGNEDFTSNIGNYCLRVERMDKDYWWWCVYFKDDYAGFDEPRAKTECEAKNYAESAFRSHFKK